MDLLKLSWIAIGVLSTLIIVCQIFCDLKSRESYFRDLQDRVEHNGTVTKVRLVPGKFTPGSAGVACFVLVTAFVGGAFFVLAYAEVHSLPTAVTVVLAVVAGAAAGWFDYRFTINGNAEGRWDLIVDRANDRLQLPAPGAWGKASQLRISDVIDLTVAPLIPDPEDHPTILVLTLRARIGGIRTSHKVAYSENETELAVLRDWIASQVSADKNERPELQGVAG